MVAYKAELLKAEAPEEESAESAKPAKKEEHKDLTDKEKDALVREELAQLRANLQAKKKRDKKKVCGTFMLFVLHFVHVISHFVLDLGRIPVVLATISVGMLRINPPDSRYAPILTPDLLSWPSLVSSVGPRAIAGRFGSDMLSMGLVRSSRWCLCVYLCVGGIQSPYRCHSIWTGP
jgi:hypothetical protein